MSEKPEKLSKKQLKALAFKAKKSQKATDEFVQAKKRKAEDEPPKKKRKTRRGHHGRGKTGHTGPRYILFVGNLPYDLTEEDLKEHFKGGEPDVIRLRHDKGFAFLEFEEAKGPIQKRIDACLVLHHSSLKGRKINVELTAGGGGNSKNRLDKIKTKNDKVQRKRAQSIKKRDGEKEAQKKEKEEQVEELRGTGMHPSRLAMMKQ